MIDENQLSDRSWARKFRDAFRGMKEGVRGQSSFFAHFFMCAAVLVAGVVLKVERIEWYILILCMTVVLTAEMFNSALESMAKAITGETDPHLGNSLDIGSGAVLTASLGASAIGCLLFGYRLGSMMRWW
jgi:diacylglycerol kinase